MDHTKEFTHISLCAGYGGIDIGLKRALGSVLTVAFSEVEAYAVCNLVAKIEKGWVDAAPIWSDLKTFPWESFRGKVDILSGGFPCQPFSVAGEKTGDEDPRHLWPFITKGIKQLENPPIVFLENVEGIISSKLQSKQWTDPINTPVLLHVLRELERMDYTTTAGIFSASEVRAPHQRKRVFILAVSNRLTDGGRCIVSSAIKRADDDRTISPIERYYSREYRAAYPAFRNTEQYEYEAPRTIPCKLSLDDSIHNRLQESRNESTDNNKKEKEGKASVLTITSNNESMGYTDKQRLERQILTEESSQKIKISINGSSSHGHIQRISKSKVGRDAHGATNRMGSSDLFTANDNRTDELRLLGNGVVPDTAKKAFITLWGNLNP